jgi:hypothetical protein
VSSGGGGGGCFVAASSDSLKPIIALWLALAAVAGLRGLAGRRNE